MAIPIKKFAIIAILIVVVGISGRFIYSSIVQSRRDAEYQAVLTTLQHDLPIGTDRNHVEQYLTFHKYNWHAAPADIVIMGEEPGDGFACVGWGVYIFLDFSSTSKPHEDLSPADTLKTIRITKVGHCL